MILGTISFLGSERDIGLSTPDTLSISNYSDEVFTECEAICFMTLLSNCFSMFIVYRMKSDCGLCIVA